MAAIMGIMFGRLGGIGLRVRQLKLQTWIYKSMSNIFFSIGAILAAISVSLGAFATHAATKFMTEQQLDWMEKAARYNMYHALALFARRLGAHTLDIPKRDCSTLQAGHSWRVSRFSLEVCTLWRSALCGWDTSPRWAVWRSSSAGCYSQSPHGKVKLHRSRLKRDLIFIQKEFHMSSNSFFAKFLRFIGIVLMALTGGFTLLGGIGTILRGILPHKI